MTTATTILWIALTCAFFFALHLLATWAENRGCICGPELSIFWD